MYFLRVYQAVFRLVNVWKGGMYLNLPGLRVPTGKPQRSLVVPRMGIFLADLPEQRLIGATTAWHSARCTAQVQFTAFGREKVARNPRAVFNLNEELKRVPKLAEVRT